MSATLKDRVCIVTGGASGIGFGIVTAMVERGAKVVIVDIDEAAAKAALERLGPQARVHYINGDITAAEGARAIVAETVATFGTLHVLVNNAHASQQAPLVDTTQEQWALSLNSGLFGTVHMMTAAYPELVKTKGAVVNFGSTAAMLGHANQASYGAAKEAIRAVSRTAANEWAADGVRVNVVCPVALTGGIQEWGERFPKEYAKVLAGIPLGRLGDPATDIAPVVLFLAGDDSRYVTGQTVMADGGATQLR